MFDKFYDKIGVGITIDRNPIGLHKLSPKFKGIVVVYITLETLIRYNNSGKKSYEFEMRSAFSAHLQPHFIYSITIMYKKRKYNITLAETRIILNQNNINRNHNVIIDWIISEITHFDASEVKKYGNRLHKSSEIIRILFTPIVDNDNKKLLKTNKSNLVRGFCTFNRSFSSMRISDNNYELRGPLFKNLQKTLNETEKAFKNSSIKDYTKSNTGNLFLPGDDSIFYPNLFRSRFKKGYKDHLYNILQDNKIVSTVFKVCINNNEFRNLGCQFGYKFSYDEVFNWNFGKSPYYKILYKYHYESLQLTDENKKDRRLIETFDYKFMDHEAPLNLDQLYSRLIGYIFDRTEDYGGPLINYYIISFTQIHGYIDHEKPIKNINSIPLKKNISNIRNIRKAFNSSMLPLTLDESFYGRRNYSTKREYIDEVNKIKRVVIEKSPKKSEKLIYSLKTNKLIDSFIDELVDDTTFIRTNPKTKSSITIKDNKVLKSSININLPAITTPKKKKAIANSFNKNIGSFDLETYSKNGKSQVYSLGFAHGGNNVMISKPEIKSYYLKKGQNSDDLILECINEMLKTKYHKTIFYTHNFGGYDVFYVLHTLARYNEKIGVKHYNMKALFRDNKVLKLEITVKSKKSRSNTIYFADSLALLPTSLKSLAKGFSTEYLKPYFPYTFVTEKTLYYEGSTPSIEFFHSLKEDISLEEYNKLYQKNWNLKEQTLKYLESDLISLLQIMYEFSNHVFDNHQVQVTECFTITSLAVKIFLNKYYKVISLALLKKPDIYRDLKEGYYGGLSEVYRRYGENLYYYDVNSLYPFSSLKDMPGRFCKYIEAHSEDGLNIIKDELFGFFYCDVKTTHDYFGLLPYRLNGLLTYPVGEFSGWFFSPLIEYALKRGYKINIRKGYSFNRVPDVFKRYVLDIYKEKQESTGAKRLIAKFLLNALLGRFGMHIDKRISELVEADIFEDLITKFEVFEEKRIINNLILITRASDPSKVICEQHGLNYIDVLNEIQGLSKSKEETPSIRNVSIGVASAVTSYSSMYMSEIKEFILASGGKIFYTDTDSIVTDIKLPERYVGSALGLFKLEHEIIRGYFISSKLYCLVVRCVKTNTEKTIISEGEDAEDEDTVVKAKGVVGKKLTEDDFKQMLDNKIIKHGVKTQSIKSYEKGYVMLENKEDIHLNPNNYVKRIKLFDKNSGKWINTRPLVIGCELSEDLWSE